MKMEHSTMQSKEYWNSNLDTDNLSREGGACHVDLEEALALAATPEFDWICEQAGDLILSGHAPLVDLGGGIGMHALLWARAGAQVIVVDMAVERLRALRQIVKSAGLEDQILLVAGTAEALPLRDETMGGVFTKSVLIHTRLTDAANEITRVLVPGGKGLFIEPLTGNPLIRLYRRFLAPKEWRDITRYFDQGALDELGQPFQSTDWRPFYLMSAGSFFWQYGRKSLKRFQKSIAFWWRQDKRLLRALPFLRGWCWFAACCYRKSE